MLIEEPTEDVTGRSTVYCSTHLTLFSLALGSVFSSVSPCLLFIFSLSLVSQFIVSPCHPSSLSSLTVLILCPGYLSSLTVLILCPHFLSSLTVLAVLTTSALCTPSLLSLISHLAHCFQIVSSSHNCLLSP